MSIQGEEGSEFGASAVDPNGSPDDEDTLGRMYLPEDHPRESRKMVELKDGRLLTMHLKEYSPPRARGGISKLLLEELKGLTTENEPYILFDFSPEAHSHLAGFWQELKRRAEETFIFDPLDQERLISLFGDFGKESKSKLCRLEHALPLITRHVWTEEVRPEFDGIYGVLSDLGGNSDDKLSLFKLLFSYDQKCFERMIVESKVGSDQTQRIRDGLSKWFSLFNEYTLSSGYLTNPFFVRALTADECPWDAMFMLFRLDLTKVPLRDAQWMAEVAIIARLQALLAGNVLSLPPRRITAEDLDRMEAPLVALVKRAYTQVADHYVWSKQSHEGLSFTDFSMMRDTFKGNTSYSYNNLNIVVIDDDIELVDIVGAIKNAVRAFEKSVSIHVNLHVQRGGSLGEDAGEPSEQGIKIADAIKQLSRLKWARPTNEIQWDQRVYIEHIYKKFEPFFEAAYNRGSAGSDADVRKALARRYLRYEIIDEAENRYPLGIIEDISISGVAPFDV